MLNKKEINSLAIPAILYNITEPLIGLVDTAIIGQIGEDSTIAQGGVLPNIQAVLLPKKTEKSSA